MQNLSPIIDSFPTPFVSETRFREIITLVNVFIWSTQICQTVKNRQQEKHTQKRNKKKEKSKDKYCYFSAKFEEVVEEPLLYGDFMVPSADNKQYIFIEDHAKVNSARNTCYSATPFWRRLVEQIYLSASDGASGWRVSGRLQPGEHCADEAGFVHGRSDAHVSHLAHHQTTTG